MSSPCRLCVRYEKKLKDLNDNRINMWRRGVLTEEVSAKLAEEERRLSGELRGHKAAEHKASLAATGEVA